MAADPIVDLTVLSDLRSVGEGDAVLTELLGIFLRDSPERVRAMRSYGDRAAIGREAHKLRGSAATLGFPALASACARVEDATAGEGDVSFAIDEVERLYLVTKDAIERL